MTTTQPVTRPSPWPRVAALSGLVLQVVGVGYVTLASGLLAPLYGLVVLWLLWAAGVAAAVLLLRVRSAWGLLVPVAGLAVWFAVLSAGEAFLGWTP